MASKSSIEWCDATWTPIRARRLDDGKIGVHCERVSPGCANCYSAKFNRRRLPNQGTGLDFVRSSRDKVEIFLDENMLAEPLRWRKPKKVFVCSQTDLFAEFVPFEFIDKVWAVMLLSPHTYQILTKRPDRMRAYLADESLYVRVLRVADQELRAKRPKLTSIGISDPVRFPSRRIWLGVSVENQQTADERIPLLLQTSAAVRSASYEPALEGVDFSPWLGRLCVRCGAPYNPQGHCSSANCQGGWGERGPSLDLIIVGGESGPGARPFNVQWARDVVRQCKEAGVAVFVKQMGSNAQERNDRIADDWFYADGSDMDTEPLDADSYRYQGAPVRLKLKDRKGGSMEEWPEDLRVREFPK